MARHPGQGARLSRLIEDATPATRGPPHGRGGHEAGPGHRGRSPGAAGGLRHRPVPGSGPALRPPPRRHARARPRRGPAVSHDHGGGRATQPRVRGPSRRQGGGAVGSRRSLARGGPGLARAPRAFGLHMHAPAPSLPRELAAHRSPRWPAAVPATPPRDARAGDTARAGPRPRQCGWRAGGEHPWPAARRLRAPRDRNAAPRTRAGRVGTLGPWTAADGGTTLGRGTRSARTVSRGWGGARIRTDRSGPP
jgi:hypothetical protein